MAQPKLKLFGNLLTNGLKEAFKVESAKSEYNGEPQLKISGAQWEDGNITIDVWDGANKKSIKIGQLRVSTLDNNSAPKKVEESGNEDLPF